MEGEPASWDLSFAGIKPFNLAASIPSRTHAASFRRLGGAGSDPRPVQPAVRRRAAPASLTARPGFPGGARTRAPSLHRALVVPRMGSGIQRPRVGGYARGPVPQPSAWRGGYWKAEGCQERAQPVPGLT